MPELNDLSTEEERQFAQGQPRGFPFDPDFRMEDVMMPEDDDMGIASEDDEVAEEEIQTETGFGSVIGIVDKPTAILLRNSIVLQFGMERHADMCLLVQLLTTVLKCPPRSKRSLLQ